MKSLFEWIREDPESVKRNRKKELERSLPLLERDYKEIAGNTGSGASHLDAPDEGRIPTDAKRRDELADRIVKVKKELGELGGPVNPES